MGYVLDGPHSIAGSARFFASPQRPDRFWSLETTLLFHTLCKADADHSSRVV
jgi:hypothetical protein